MAARRLPQIRARRVQRATTPVVFSPGLVGSGILESRHREHAKGTVPRSVCSGAAKRCNVSGQGESKMNAWMNIQLRDPEACAGGVWDYSSVPAWRPLPVSGARPGARFPRGSGSTCVEGKGAGPLRDARGRRLPVAFLQARSSRPKPTDLGRGLRLSKPGLRTIARESTRDGVSVRDGTVR